MHYGYIYKITNLINGKIYVGLRSSSTFDKAYWGGGSDIHAARLEFGIENFEREILQWCDSYDELCRAEKYWIEKLNARNPDIGYNIQPGGVREYGYAHAESTKQRLKMIAKNRRKYGYWINNGIIEKYYNPESDIFPEGFIKGRLPATMKKAGLSHRGHKVEDTSNLHKAKGKRWFTNGERDTMAFDCPEGFWLGRTNIPDTSGQNNPMYGKVGSNTGKPMSEESKLKLSLSQKERLKQNPKHWITNNEIECLVNVSDNIPVGFVCGRLKKNIR